MHLQQYLLNVAKITKLDFSDFRKYASSERGLKENLLILLLVEIIFKQYSTLQISSSKVG